MAEQQRHQGSSASKIRWASFWGLSCIQSVNSLNEKGVQFLLIALGIWLLRELQYPLSILIVLPFVLLSPPAGWLADRFCKTRVLQVMVLLQVLVLAGMTTGLFRHSLPLAVGFFTVFCMQAVIFSPAKKGLVKDMVGTENIGFASGILEITSMLALLIGQIAALFIVYRLLQQWGENSGWEAAAWPCLVCTIGAVAVFLLSLGMPRYAPQSRRPFRISLFWEHFSQLRLLWQKPVLRNSEVGIGYFWFIAGMMMLIALQMAADVHTTENGGELSFMQVLGQQKDSALLMAWISGGSIMGGAVSSFICAKRIRTWVAGAGGIGMTLGCILLALIPYGSTFFFCSLAFTGFMAAGYLVPLNALLQDRADDDKRGDVIAAGNLVDCFLGIAAVLIQQTMRSIGLTPQMQCALLAVSSAVVACFIIRTMRSV